MLSYLETSNLLAEYQEGETVINQTERTNLVIADLAAGTGWASALLSKLPRVKTVHAVEISKHRIGSLFEDTVNVMSGNRSKINRYLGSFYKTGFADSSIDIVFLSQAFHHADNPFRLLDEVSRILRQGGLVLLIGEHFIDWKRILRRIASELIQERRFVADFYSLFKPDPVLGDHYYRVSDYFFLAKSLGFDISLKRLESGNAMYILRKP